MQSGGNPSKQLPTRGLKQVKVDNWGSFFLHRLQQLYFEEELLDLTIKFPTSDITVQAHRLVITTCTDYFMQLERQLKEKDENFDGVLIMPPDMPYECVKSIISFMYTGQLEYWTSEQNALYRTAQKMNMTVLTKLLDAQFNTSSLQSSPTPAKTNVQPIMVPQKPASPVKKNEKSNNSGSLPSQPLPGRKLPIWKRKLDSQSPNHDAGSYRSPSQRQQETNPGPSRFDLPEVDDFALGVFSSFDDITYNTRPIVQAPDNCSNDGGTNSGCNRSSLDFDRSGKNDSTEDEDEEMHRVMPDNSQSRGSDDKWENSDDEWTGPKPILRSQDGEATPSKRVRFELEEKENVDKSKNESSSDDAINNHAKIIREVLKKYPHLVKNNKNIRLKIMQKEAKSSDLNATGKTKVSYVVLKSDHLLSNSATAADDAKIPTNTSHDGAENGPWKCNKCDLDEEYTNYYMYRRHMQDVHGEKFDPRVCEHCGYKATKRNILMYHLYTKHNVPPPKNMSFPKCHACTYVALSESLLVRHQINHNHRPRNQTNVTTIEEVQCPTCSQTFKDVNELASHEINTGHGNSMVGKEKGNRCPHCGKVFVRMTNLQVHMDCAHKDIREAEHRAEIVEHAVPIALEPSSEAEALSHVVSGIAASLGVGCDAIANDHQDIVVATDETYPICNTEVHLNNMEEAYNGHELVQGQQMIMLIDGEAYQPQQQPEEPHQHHHLEHQHVLDNPQVIHHQQLNVEDSTLQGQTQQPHQLEISGDEQIVMQGTDEGMIVYIHGTEGVANDRQTYETYQTVEIGGHESEEIVEEVEEEVEEVEEVVEEVEEEVEEELVEEELVDEQQTHGNETVLLQEHEMIEHTNGEQQIEEVIQYVEEETEIVEYDDGIGRQVDGDNNGVALENSQQQSVMIIEEEHVEGDESMEIVQDQRNNDAVRQTEGQNLADEWDEDSAEITET